MSEELELALRRAIFFRQWLLKQLYHKPDTSFFNCDVSPLPVRKITGSLCEVTKQGVICYCYDGARTSYYAYATGKGIWATTKFAERKEFQLGWSGVRSFIPTEIAEFFIVNDVRPALVKQKLAELGLASYDSRFASGMTLLGLNENTALGLDDIADLAVEEIKIRILESRLYMPVKKEEDFPIQGFVYDNTGHYAPPVQINNSREFRRFLITEASIALREGREIRVTDRTRDDCLFHIESGKVVFNGGDNPHQTEALLKSETIAIVAHFYKQLDYHVVSVGELIEKITPLELELKTAVLLLILEHPDGVLLVTEYKNLRPWSVEPRVERELKKHETANPQIPG